MRDHSHNEPAITMAVEERIEQQPSLLDSKLPLVLTSKSHQQERSPKKKEDITNPLDCSSTSVRSSASKSGSQRRQRSNNHRRRNKDADHLSVSSSQSSRRRRRAEKNATTAKNGDDPLDIGGSSHSHSSRRSHRDNKSSSKSSSGSSRHRSDPLDLGASSTTNRRRRHTNKEEKQQQRQQRSVSPNISSSPSREKQRQGSSDSIRIGSGTGTGTAPRRKIRNVNKSKGKTTQSFSIVQNQQHAENMKLLEISSDKLHDSAPIIAFKNRNNTDESIQSSDIDNNDNLSLALDSLDEHDNEEHSESSIDINSCLLIPNKKNNKKSGSLSPKRSPSGNIPPPRTASGNIPLRIASGNIPPRTASGNIPPDFGGNNSLTVGLAALSKQFDESFSLSEVTNTPDTNESSNVADNTNTNTLHQCLTSLSKQYDESFCEMSVCLAKSMEDSIVDMSDRTVQFNEDINQYFDDHSCMKQRKPMYLTLKDLRRFKKERHHTLESLHDPSITVDFDDGKSVFSCDNSVTWDGLSCASNESNESNFDFSELCIRGLEHFCDQENGGMKLQKRREEYFRQVLQAQEFGKPGSAKNSKTDDPNNNSKQSGLNMSMNMNINLKIGGAGNKFFKGLNDKLKNTNDRLKLSQHRENNGGGGGGAGGIFNPYGKKNDDDDVSESHNSESNNSEQSISLVDVEQKIAEAARKYSEKEKHLARQRAKQDAIEAIKIIKEGMRTRRKQRRK